MGELDDRSGETEDRRVDAGHCIRRAERYGLVLVDPPGVDGLEDRFHPGSSSHAAAGNVLVEEGQHGPCGRQPRRAAGVLRAEGVERRQPEPVQHGHAAALRQAHQLHHRADGHRPGQLHRIEPRPARVLRNQPPPPLLYLSLPAGDRCGREPTRQDPAQPRVLLTVGRQDRPGQLGEGPPALGPEQVGGAQDGADLVIAGDRPHAVALQPDGRPHEAHRLVDRIGVREDPLVEEVEGGSGRGRGHRCLRWCRSGGAPVAVRGGLRYRIPGWVRSGSRVVSARGTWASCSGRSRAAVSGSPHGTGGSRWCSRSARSGRRTTAGPYAGAATF